MRFVIVTGMSGAGRNSVMKMLEDMGYFCVDNLPVRLIPRMTGMMLEENSLDKVAIGIGILMVSLSLRAASSATP